MHREIQFLHSAFLLDDSIEEESEKDFLQLHLAGLRRGACCRDLFVVDMFSGRGTPFRDIKFVLCVDERTTSGLLPRRLSESIEMMDFIFFICCFCCCATDEGARRKIFFCWRGFSFPKRTTVRAHE